MGSGTALLVAGLAMIVHAALAIMKYRTELKALDMQFTSAPWNVVAECFAGMALCVFGTATSGGKLLPVFAKREPYEKSVGAASLMTFNHRARGLAAWDAAS